MAMGPFSITQPNSTHELMDPTQPTTDVGKPEPTQPNVEQKVSK